MSDTTLGGERLDAAFDDVDPRRWVAVCAIDRIVPDSGVAALVDGRQVAVFRFGDEDVFALGNHDPFSGANVLARGILGDQGGIPFVSSPIFKQRFDLRSGECLADPSVRVSVHAVRVVGGTVLVGVDPATLDGRS
jgi:NAD(P)H-dependent nitrite reductase small subunit